MCKRFYGYQRIGLTEGIALIGYALHFSLRDIKNMAWSEFLDYIEISKKIVEVKI